MNILITGGTAFVSRTAAAYFARRGDSVTVLNRGNRPQPEGVTSIIADRMALGERLRGRRFDAVLDITAYTEEHVKALLDSGVQFDDYIFISSSAVYNDAGDCVFREDAPCGENAVWGAYGANKRKAELYLRAHCPQAYVLRPPYLYGEWNNIYREAFVFDCADADRPFYLPREGEMRLQFFHAEDLCRFISLLLERHPAERVYNVGNPQAVTVREWVTLCYRAAGKEPTFVSVSGEVPQRSYFCFHDYAYYLDVSRMASLMPDTLPLDEGLRRSYKFYRRYPDCIYRRNPYLVNIAELKLRD